MEYYTNILNAIGNTPLLELTRISDGTVFAKAEYLNPGGSIKDRVAKYLLDQAEKTGRLRPGMTVAEATSGNTGIGVTLVGVHKGYRVVIVMPEDMSEERKKIIRALGAELILSPADKSIPGAVDRVNDMAAADPNIFIVGQFENPDNPEAHYLTTGPEVWRQMEGDVAAFVAGVGSGGTIGGAGKFLKERNPEVRLVAVEPANAAALLGHEPGLHQIQGIGDGFIPPVLDTSLLDDVVTVTDDDAIETTRRLAREEGTLVGTSSGANVWAALRVSEQLGPGRNVVTVLPDRAERYFSTSLI
ncbi:MAG: cysteine synthase A [Planctomycetota bacterium]